jgi:MFS transporter, SP family, galactose:H+ symporter
MSLIEAQQQVEEMTRMSMRPSTSTSTTTSSAITIDITENSNSNGIQVIEEVKEETIKEKFSEIFDSKYSRQALIIGVGLVVFQQFSGQPSVLYFANRIFEKAGLGYEAALGVGVFKLVMTIISAGLVENPKFGRRPLLLYGNIGVTVSLAALSLLYSVPLLPPDLNQIAIIISILFFVGSYQIGFGPISWLILSEIFPLRIRSTAVSIGTLFNFGSNLLVATLFELERVSLGEGVLFGQFALIALMATIFTYKYVFETRGLSLEEIELKLKEIVDGENKE